MKMNLNILGLLLSPGNLKLSQTDSQILFHFLTESKGNTNERGCNDLILNTFSELLTIMLIIGRSTVIQS